MWSNVVFPFVVQKLGCWTYQKNFLHVIKTLGIIVFQSTVVWINVERVVLVSISSLAVMLLRAFTFLSVQVVGGWRMAGCHFSMFFLSPTILWIISYMSGALF